VITQHPRYAATMLKDIVFGSGRVAVNKGQAVQVEVYEDTMWIYDVDTPHVPGKLLYTLGEQHNRREYVAIGGM
jgi:hypothetical protein